jgi:methylated-DNA-[protein]-cysteine S-methyltransferase
VNEPAIKAGLSVARVETPLGVAWVTASARGVRAVRIGRGEDEPSPQPPPSGRGSERRTHPPAPSLREGEEIAARAAAEMRAYFAGEVTRFETPLDWVGTEFQRAVWRRLVEIPMGETITYGTIAAELGSPGAARAVGLANHDNRIWVMVPCHRVVGADGSLTGYAGGLERKRWLLDHESRVAGKVLWANRSTT